MKLKELDILATETNFHRVWPNIVEIRAIEKGTVFLHMFSLSHFINAFNSMEFQNVITFLFFSQM